jgi:hypothetical protein
MKRSKTVAAKAKQAPVTPIIVRSAKLKQMGGLKRSCPSTELQSNF